MAAVNKEVNLPTMIGIGFTIIASLGSGVSFYAASAARSAVAEQRLSTVEKDAETMSKGLIVARGENIGLEKRADALDARLTDIQRRTEIALDRIASTLEGLRSERRRASMELVP